MMQATMRNLAFVGIEQNSAHESRQASAALIGRLAWWSAALCQPSPEMALQVVLLAELPSSELLVLSKQPVLEGDQVRAAAGGAVLSADPHRLPPEMHHPLAYPIPPSPAPLLVRTFSYMQQISSEVCEAQLECGKMSSVLVLALSHACCQTAQNSNDMPFLGYGYAADQ